MAERRVNLTPTGECPCAGCAALAVECGPGSDLLSVYRVKLLQRGWAGPTSAAEKVYQRSHAFWAQQAVARGFPGRGRLEENTEHGDDGGESGV